jgi:glycogen synthase
MMSDPLQTGYFCDHLQHLFSRNPPAGIENGFFGTRQKAFTPEAISSASAGDFSMILQEKTAHRNRLLDVLQKPNDHRASGRLMFGRKDSGAPVLFMSGRMDLRQKGFDIIFHAISRLKAGSVKLLFCPINPEGDSLDFFVRFTERYDGDICIWPFRLPDQIYATCLMGAGYLVMPSLYEPFGAANEGYLHGVPVIARATGGLWSQVNPAVPCNTPGIFSGLDNGTRAVSGNPTGLLFREGYESGDIGKQWRDIMDAKINERLQSKLYNSIVDAAGLAINQAIELYSNDLEYARMLLNCAESTKHSGWSRAAYSYRRVYDTASNMTPFD